MTRRKPVTEIGDNGRENSERWHVNRGIPVVWLLASTFGIGFQIAAFLWWAGAFNARVEFVEKAVAAMAPQGERLTRLEEKVITVQAGVSRIEALLTKPASR